MDKPLVVLLLCNKDITKRKTPQAWVTGKTDQKDRDMYKKQFRLEPNTPEINGQLVINFKRKYKKIWLKIVFDPKKIGKNVKMYSDGCQVQIASMKCKL